MEEIVDNRMLFGFVAGNVTVYLKEATEYRNHYAVKVMHKDGTKTVVHTSTSLSSAMREMAETIAQFTGGFTSWRQL